MMSIETSFTLVFFNNSIFIRSTYWKLGLSRFTHVTIRFDSVRSRSDPIHYPSVQTNTAKIYNSECHLNDSLNKITMNEKHKINHNTSDGQ